eukprot:2126055-Rhodomonas_salina.2
MCGTDLAYAATRSLHKASTCMHPPMTSLWCDAACGTKLAYGAARCGVLRWRTVLSYDVWCYAGCGTERAYGVRYYKYDYGSGPGGDQVASCAMQYRYLSTAHSLAPYAGSLPYTA